MLTNNTLHLVTNPGNMHPAAKTKLEEGKIVKGIVL